MRLGPRRAVEGKDTGTNLKEEAPDRPPDANTFHPETAIHGSKSTGVRRCGRFDGERVNRSWR